MGEVGREATVVLVHRGKVAGALPPVSLPMPWWPEAHDVVAAVRDRDGLDITVLRLLSTRSDRIAGGRVSYLAETDRLPSGTLRPWPVDPLAEQPLRQRWARPGGPTELLDWASDRLAAQGLVQTGPAEQMRTWNLSAIWRIPTAGGHVWFKAVPAFFAHEGAVINWIGEPVAPSLIDFAPGRTLMSDIDHAQNHEVREPDSLRSMVALLTGLQRRAVVAVDQLLAIGVPDRRLPTMITPIATVVEKWAGSLTTDERRLLDSLIAGLPARLRAVEDCGVPDTLVHGDFHPGNVAGRPGTYVILDWGDSFVGHPLLDELAFTRRLDPASRRRAREWFVADWQRIAPGSDPGRAADLLEPVVALLAAVMYTNFCANIEPDERVYHASDLVQMLREAARTDVPGVGLDPTPERHARLAP